MQHEILMLTLVVCSLLSMVVVYKEPFLKTS
jgi:hypothetical protein